MISLHEFVGRADHWRLVTCLPAYQFNPRAHCRIGDMPEVPSYQIINAVRDGNSNMRGICSGFAWNRTAIKQKPG